MLLLKPIIILLHCDCPRRFDFADAAKRTDKKDKEVLFKNCAPFTEGTIEINSIQIDYAKDLDVVMPMYNLIENSDIIQKHQEVYGNIIEMNQLLQ